MMPKTNISARVRPDIRAAVDYAAEDTSRSMGQVVELALAAWLRANGYLPPAPEKASRYAMEAA